MTVHSVFQNAPISNRMFTVFKATVKNDMEFMQIRQLLQSDTRLDKSALSAELKAYAKVLSDIYEADGILFLNHVHCVLTCCYAYTKVT